MDNNRLPASMVHSYGFATMAFSAMMLLAINYYTFFLTDVALIAPADLVIFMFLTHAVDAISIPISGIVIQRTQFRWGQFRSWLWFMPLSTFVFFSLTFTNIPSIAYYVKVVYLALAYLLAHVSLNFAYNAHVGLISVLSRNLDDRAKLSERNIQYSYGAQLIFSIAAIPALNFFRGSFGESRGFFYTVIILAAFQITGYMNLFFRSKEYDSYDPNKKLSSSSNIPLLEMFRMVISNKNLLIIMLADIIKDVAIFGLVSIAVYYFKYVTGDDSWMRSYTLSVGIVTLCSTLVSPYIIKRVGKKQTCIYTAFIGVIGYLLLRMFGTNGPVTYISIVCCTNFIVSMALPIRQAMYLDTSEYGYYRSGKDVTAFLLSMYTIPVKIGGTLVLTIIPAFLAYIGYVPNMEPTPEFINSLMNLISFLPAGCYLLTGIVFIFYELDEKRMSSIMEANAKKRAKAEI